MHPHCSDMTMQNSLRGPNAEVPRWLPCPGTKHPSTYLLQLVRLLIVALQLLPQHVVLLREHLHHLLCPLHDGEGIGRQLLARRCRCQRLGSGRGRQRWQGAWEQRAGGGLRGHGAVLLGRWWEGRLALSAAGKHTGEVLEPHVLKTRPGAFA